jgi:hypothetical protein
MLPHSQLGVCVKGLGFAGVGNPDVSESNGLKFLQEFSKLVAERVGSVEFSSKYDPTCLKFAVVGQAGHIRAEGYLSLAEFELTFAFELDSEFLQSTVEGLKSFFRRRMQ